MFWTRKAGLKSGILKKPHICQKRCLTDWPGAGDIASHIAFQFALGSQIVPSSGATHNVFMANGAYTDDAMRRTPTLRHNEMATTLVTEAPHLECLVRFVRAAVTRRRRCAATTLCSIPEVRLPQRWQTYFSFVLKGQSCTPVPKPQMSTMSV